MAQTPLTIAIMSNLYPPYVIGGNELFIRDVAEALRERGHRVHILTGHGREFPNNEQTHQVLNLELDYKDDIFLGGIPLNLRRVLQWHLFSLSAYKDVLQALKKIQPDLIVASNLYMASAAPLIAARRLPSPLVVQPMDKWLVYSLSDIGMLIPAHTRLQKLALIGIKYGLQPLLRLLGRPDYILAVSEFIRNVHTRAGFNAEQSKAIYLGIPIEHFPYQPHPFPQTRPWRALFAGQLWHGKGPQVAIEAISRLRNYPDLPPVELSICGSGTPLFLNQLREQIDTLGLRTQVHLRGFVPRDQLKTELNQHDLFLFCSIWDEPYSIVLQEALATGIPTIATTAGGTPETMVDGKHGLLVEPNQPEELANAIRTLMSDPVLYAQVGLQAAEDVRNQRAFTKYVDELEAIYQGIVSGHRSNHPIAFERSAMSSALAQQHTIQGE